MNEKMDMIKYVVTGVVLVSALVGSVLLHSLEAFGGAIFVTLAILFSIIEK